MTRDTLLTSDTGTTYGYDAPNRVSSASSTSYQYDAADQLKQIAVSGGNATTVAYDIAGEVKTSTVTNGQTQVSKLTYAFDASGNRTRTIDQVNANASYGYDAADRLTTFNSATAFDYNGDGLRMSKTTASPEAFVWNIVEGLPTLLQDGATNYVAGLGGLPLEQVTQGGTVFIYHADQIGSVRVLTDANGAVQQSYTYDPWGSLTSSSGTVANPLRFAGQYFDVETSLYYLRARYYDPGIGQFISVDPVLAITRAPYTYAADSPLNAVDPSGLDEESEGGKEAGDLGAFSTAESSAAAGGSGGGGLKQVCGRIWNWMTGGDSQPASSAPTLRPDVRLSGGRSGQNVKNLTGPPNSVVRGSEGRAFQTDDQGRVVSDINETRVKPVAPGQGFGPKRDPNAQELDWLRRLWKDQ